LLERLLWGRALTPFRPGLVLIMGPSAGLIHRHIRSQMTLSGMGIGGAASNGTD